jgi:thioesterase domain-containing protein
MGVDSLMSVAIIDAIKKSTNISVPAAFFTVHRTVGAMRKALSEMIEPVVSEEASALKPDQGALEPVKTAALAEEKLDNPPLPASSMAQPQPLPAVPSRTSETAAEPQPQAPATEKVVPKAEVVPAAKKYSSNVVLLQGRPSSGQTPLFLLVDGAGSSTAYLHLPFFSTKLPVYALESPFLHCPIEYTISIHEMAQLFVEAIRKTQPKGPYMLGGWSAGSAYAYEVACILINEGETVLGLILLDMRVPRPMPDGLELTMDILDQVGLTAGIKRAGKGFGAISDLLRQHLLSTVKQLMVYNAQPMPEDKRPLKTVIIWAKKGMIDVIKEQGLKIPEWAQEIEEMDGNVMEDEGLGLVGWFYGKRTDFGPNGWDKLLGDVETHVVEGADHFSLVSPPIVRETARIMQEAVAAFTSKA